MTQPVMHTERLILRGHVIGDFEPYAAMFASDRAVHMGQLKRRHAWYSFTSDVAQWTLHRMGAWAITGKQDGAFLGQAAVMQPDHFPEPELGWFVVDGAEGKGFACEAATTILAWWWQQSQANTLVSYIDPGNARSVALARKLGAAPDMSATLPGGEAPEETTVYRHFRPEAA